MITFDEWLKRFRPNIYLTPMQRKFIRLLESGRIPCWVGGRQTGHTTAVNLWRDYLHHVTTNPTLRSSEK